MAETPHFCYHPYTILDPLQTRKNLPGRIGEVGKWKDGAYDFSPWQRIPKDANLSCQCGRRGTASSASPNVTNSAATSSTQSVAGSNAASASTPASGASQINFDLLLAQLLNSLSGSGSTTTTDLLGTLTNLADTTGNTQTLNNFLTQLLNSQGGLGNQVSTNLLSDLLGTTSTTGTTGTDNILNATSLLTQSNLLSTILTDLGQTAPPTSQTTAATTSASGAVNTAGLQQFTLQNVVQQLLLSNQTNSVLSTLGLTGII